MVGSSLGEEEASYRRRLGVKEKKV